MAAPEVRDPNLGHYVLVRNRTENGIWSRGPYDVTWVPSLDKIDPQLQEVVEVSRSTSGAEWVRLVEERDRLRDVSEVMGS